MISLHVFNNVTKIKTIGHFDKLKEAAQESFENLFLKITKVK